MIGVTGQYSATDKLLTGRENLMLMADLYHLARARARARTEELLERFGLTEAAGKLVATYSGGMQRKLDLAMTLVSDPRIIFLDEPTTGLDPRSRRTMWQIVEDLTRGGVTIFLTTQCLEEADQLAGQHAGRPVGGAVIQTTLAMAAVTGIALLTGFRATTSAANWLAAAAILVLFAFALTWLSVALGLAAKTVESASNAPTPLTILAFLGSGFVLTPSMPTAIRWFAEYQPFTPVIDTVRGLLVGGPIGHNAIYAIAWSLVIAIGSYLWARKLFSRDPVHS